MSLNVFACECRLRWQIRVHIHVEQFNGEEIIETCVKVSWMMCGNILVVCLLLASALGTCLNSLFIWHGLDKSKMLQYEHCMYV